MAQGKYTEKSFALWSNSRLLGGEFVSKVQQTSAQIYYNTLVPIPEDFAEDLSKNSKYKHGKQLMKYGVIGRSDFLDDLLNWTNLYVSGRLHKPIAVLTDIEEAPVLLTLPIRTLNGS